VAIRAVFTNIQDLTERTSKLLILHPRILRAGTLSFYNNTTGPREWPAISEQALDVLSVKS
jgi:hypothetical protein